MEETIPEIIAEVQDAMPFQRYILPSGAMNMVSSVHWAMHMPDVQGKFFAGDGTLNEEWGTFIHTDLGNAANICVHAEHSPANLVMEKVEFLQQLFPQLTSAMFQAENFAALWYIFLPDQYDGVKEFLQKKHHLSTDPIQERAYIVTVKDLGLLDRDYGIRPIIFLQRVGDVVILPGNHPHQVLNINSCVKIAFDFASAMNCTQHLHNLTRVREANKREDYIGLERILFQSFTRASRTLQSANRLQKEAMRLASENSDLRARMTAMEERLETLERSSTNTRTQTAEKCIQAIEKCTTHGTQTTSVLVDKRVQAVATVSSACCQATPVITDTTVQTNPSVTSRVVDIPEESPRPSTSASQLLSQDSDVEVIEDSDNSDYEEYVPVGTKGTRKRGRTPIVKKSPPKRRVSAVQVPCTECSMIFPSTLEQSIHRKNVHHIMRPFECYQCHKSFETLYQREQHAPVHKVTCPICGKW